MAAVLVVGAVVFGGFWLYAASLESGDVLVLRQSRIQGTTIVYSLEAANELAAYDSTTDVHVSDGTIIAAMTEPPWVSFTGISSFGVAQRASEEYYADTEREFCELSIHDREDYETGSVTHARDDDGVAYLVGLE